MISGKILKANGWPEGKIIGLAKAAAESLAAAGLERDAVLAWLDSVRADPGKYLGDPKLAPLARECLRRAAATATPTSETPRERGITLLGGGLDESPQAHKVIETVAAAQDA